MHDGPQQEVWRGVWPVLRAFAERSRTLSKGTKFDKRIFVFTDRNDPTENQSDRERAEQKNNVSTERKPCLWSTQLRVQDLTENGISIELYPLNQDFSPFAFWKDIVQLSDDEDIGGIGGASKLEARL